MSRSIWQLSAYDFRIWLVDRAGKHWAIPLCYHRSTSAVGFVRGH